MIDSAHRSDELFGFNNVPMAVWIDEEGMLVRPAESASIEQSSLKTRPIPEGLPEPLLAQLTEAQKIPDISTQYRSAVADWVNNGSASKFALNPDQVVERSQPRDQAASEAAARFELGQHLFKTLGPEAGRTAAIPHWREAHRLDETNWTYKRQAWTLETTAPGQESDLLQAPTETYEGSWLNDVVASGGGENYITAPRFE